MNDSTTRLTIQSYRLNVIQNYFHQVQASLASNTFAIAGHAENKQITELLPGILNQVSDLYLQPPKAR